MTFMEKFGDDQGKDRRHRAWVFTINNYTPDDTARVHAMGAQAAYLSVGKEVGESGTPHYQGFVNFSTLKSFPQLKTMLPRAWLAPKCALSTFDQAIKYTQKDSDFYECGTRPIDPVDKGQLNKDRCARNLEAIMDGRYDDVDPDILATQLRNYEYAAAKLRAKRAPPAQLDGVLDNLWVYGKAGVGKDSYVNSLAPNAFVKDPTTRWWDGYDGQEDVIYRDLGIDHDSRALKIWTDRYPFPAEVKGGTLGLIRPKRAFVTSNYAPHELYVPQDRAAIERRFQIVHAHDGVADYKTRTCTDRPPPLKRVCYDVDAGISRGENAARETNNCGNFQGVDHDYDPDDIYLPAPRPDDHDPPSPSRMITTYDVENGYACRDEPISPDYLDYRK